MTVLNTELAWLAGLWDGEGSVGINRNHRRGANSEGFNVFPQVQIQMTHFPTIDRVVDLIKSMGCQVVSYHWAEKQAHHKRACGLRITRTGYVLTMATALLPYSVTKVEQWTLVKEFCELRIARQGLGSHGQLKRGGRQGWWVPYSEREIELYNLIGRCNRRGLPAAVERGMGAPGPSVREQLESE
ncbi:hypothetical protein [Micromonospora sp. WMMC273]|uniref:hypothetical protein n=1 Tax=Micromonospora sp. WMMC273 TaxID=3015157 RepID=UPI0022B6EFCC|nr:hypothetical protein [Micromonospora sp. WMMC273]MCZ7478935.1 hypothetical protein [Micromonospora sp. WMMC273]MCZ7478996.1 hypothetical protein [Micromonospora sp. WMMC273]